MHPKDSRGIGVTGALEFQESDELVAAAGAREQVTRLASRASRKLHYGRRYFYWKDCIYRRCSTLWELLKTHWEGADVESIWMVAEHSVRHSFKFREHRALYAR